MASADIALFSLQSGRDFAAAVAAHLAVAVAEHEEREFEDGEHKIRPLESVRNRDVYVVQSLYGDEHHPLNDKLIRLLFLLASLRENGARRVTAVVPYLCYSRKERKTKPRDPVSTRYLAQLFEAMGPDCMVTLDVHNLAAFQNAYRCRCQHLTASGLLLDHYLPYLEGKKLTVASPDVGGAKRADLFRQALERRLGRAVASAFMEKRRSEGEVSGTVVAGEVEGRTVLVVDDLVASGGTLKRAAEAFERQGAEEVFAAATHGLFSGNAEENISAAAIKRLAVSNSIPPFRLPKTLLQDKVAVVDAAPLIGEAIGRLHRGGSLTELTP